MNSCPSYVLSLSFGSADEVLLVQTCMGEVSDVTVIGATLNLIELVDQSRLKTLTKIRLDDCW